MKKTQYILISIFATLLPLVSCTEENAIEPNEYTVTFVADAPQTKTSVDVSSGNAVYSWSSSETFSFIQDATVGDAHKVSYGKELAFSLSEGIASVSATFTAIEGATHYDYYSVVPKCGINNTNVSDYKIELPHIQTWTNGSFDPVSDILISKGVGAEAPISGSQSLQYTRLAAVGKMTIKKLTLPEGGMETVKSVEFKVPGQHISGRFKVDLTTGKSSSYGYSSDYDFDYVVISRNDNSFVVVEGENDNFDVWFTCFPVELATGTSYSITVNTDATSYTKTGTIGSQSLIFSAGDVTSFGVNMASATLANREPVVNTAEAQQITTPCAVPGGSFSDNQQIISENGIYYLQSDEEPSLDDIIAEGVNLTDDAGSSPYTISVTGLTSGKDYYYVAYVKYCHENDVETKMYAYGSVEKFTTATSSYTYTKVTSAPADWTGQYLLVCESENVIFDGSLSTLDAMGNTKPVTINGNTISGDYQNYLFTIDHAGSNYSIKSASGYYIGVTAYSNGLKVSKTEVYQNTIAVDAIKAVYNNADGQYMFLAYNKVSGNLRFRYYKDTNDGNANYPGVSLYLYDDPRPRLASPQNLVVNDMTLSWSAVDNATSYSVKIGSNAAVTVNTCSYTFEGVADYYSVSVVAVDSNGAYKSSLATEVNDLKFGTPSLAKVSSVTYNVASKTVTWKTITGASSYSYSIDNGNASQASISGTTASTSELSLSAGEHTIVVTASDATGRYQSSTSESFSFTVGQDLEPVSYSWTFAESSTDWTQSGCVDYFTYPYGMKKVNAYIINKSISAFSASTPSSIVIKVSCFQNGGTSSKLTVSLVNSSGAIVGSGKVITPVNATSITKATEQSVEFTSGFSGVTGYMIKCTTFGKNILITGTGYTVTY